MTVPARPNPRRLRALVSLVAVLLATLLVPMASQAHEGHGVIATEPEDQSIVDGPPSQVLIQFEGRVLEDQASVEVFTGNGILIESGELRVDGGIVVLPISTDVQPGVYSVIYDVNTEQPNGGFHTFDGTFRYTVRPAGCTSTITNEGPYTSITAPHFATAPDVMSLAAVDKTFQQIIYATNGRELQRSFDSGCNWEVALDLAALDGAAGLGADALITDIVSAREFPGLVAVMVLDPADDGANVAQPRVWIGVGQQPLAEGGIGLPPIRFDPEQPLRCRYPQPCHVKFSDAPVVTLGIPPLYVLTKPAQELGAVRLYRSDDGGLTFNATGPIVTEQDLLGGPGLVVEAAGLAPDVDQETTVYVSTGRSVHVSFNRGDTWAEAYRLPSTEGQVITHLSAGRNINRAGLPGRDLMAVLAADQARAAPEAIVRLEARGTALERGPDLDTEPMGPVWVTSMARGAAPGQFLVLPERADKERPGVFEYEASIDGLVDLDQFGISPWLNAQATSPICTRWFGHDARRMYFVDADDGHGHVHSAEDFCSQPDEGTSDGVAVELINFPPPVDLITDTNAVLAGATATLQLEPGIAETIGYTLSRAAEDVPVDVAFLFDTSGSMRDNVEAVRSGFGQIVSELERREINAWFGLAEFADLSIRYRRLADIQPPGDNFARALAQLQIKSGENEPHRTALHQLATGEGISSPRVGVKVKPDQQMNWREEAVRIVIMASDEEFYNDPDGPSFGEVVAALQAKGIHHIGLHVREEVGQGGSSVASADNPASQSQLRDQMEEVSRATNAYAVNPIDCDGDGTNDILTGEPLVCTLPNTISTGSPLATSGALAEAIVDLVDSIGQLRTFTLQAPTPAGFTATVQAAGLTGDRSPSHLLDVTLPQTPRWAVTYSCSQSAAGATARVPVAVALQEVAIATFPTTLTCGTPPIARVGQQAPVAAVLPPPPPPPTPIPVNAPAPTAASANAFAQSAATSPAVGAAMAPQMQRQAQQAQIRDDDSDVYEFSALRTRETGPETTLALGFVMAVGAGVAMARQRQAARNHARIRVR